MDCHNKLLLVSVALTTYTRHLSESFSILDVSAVGFARLRKLHEGFLVVKIATSKVAAILNRWYSTAVPRAWGEGH